MSTGPLASTLLLRVIGVETTDPATHLNLHWCLWVTGSSVRGRIIVGQGSKRDIVDGPDDTIGIPIDSVGVEGIDRFISCNCEATIIRRRVTLSEEVGLNMTIVAAQPFPVYLIEVIGLEDEAANDTDAGGGSNLCGNLAEEDVLGGDDCWCFVGLGDAELCSLPAVCHLCSFRILPIRTLALGEVGSESRSQSWICGASYCLLASASFEDGWVRTLLGRITISECLRLCKRKCGQEHCGGKCGRTHVCLCARCVWMLGCLLIV